MKSILIVLLSDSIGDTVAAAPYVSEYQKKHNCIVYYKIQKHFIFLFENIYDNVICINDESNIKFDEKIILDFYFFKSVQGGYAEQLGFEIPTYIRPQVVLPSMDRPIKNKYISLGVHSTSQLKYWNHSSGIKSQLTSPNWNELCSYLRKIGYIPVTVERDESFGISPFWNHVPTKSVKKIGQSLLESMNVVYHSEFYIGLSSGMSWLAHAMGKKVVMISNFTEDWNEFDISSPDYIRITNKSVCHGCFNKINIDFSFDPYNWYWCPKHQNTERQFECHKLITPGMVIDQIKPFL